MTCVLSSVVSTSKEEAEPVVEVLQPRRVYEGVGIKCGLHYCVAWKMSLHGGGGVSAQRGFKKILATLTHKGKFTVLII